VLIGVLVAASATTLILLFFIPGSPLENALLDFLEWLEELPKWQGILLLISVQTVAVVLILPATPLNLAAGFLYDVWWGSVVSVVSTDLAAILAFFIGRYLARGWAEKEIDKRPKFKAVDVAVDKQGMWIIILVRFSPVFPFGLCNYLFGLTKIGFFKYWLATTIGLLPYTVAYTYLGSLMGQLVDIFTDDAGDSTQQIIFLSIGAGTTLATVVLVAWITRRALKNATRGYEEEVISPEVSIAVPSLDDKSGPEGGDLEEGKFDYHRIPDNNNSGSGSRSVISTLDDVEGKLSSLKNDAEGWGQPMERLVSEVSSTGDTPAHDRTV